MDVWVAVINAGTIDETELGVYTTEELALSAAERTTPGAFDAKHYVLDEVPSWVNEVERERRLKDATETHRA